MNSAYIGFDTSNYRTSVAVYEDLKTWNNKGRLLEVQKGALGLRQSDAVFSHVRQLPNIVKEIGACTPFKAVAASTRPRQAEGSYMPCFLVGEAFAKSMASLQGVPFYAFSHQQGHIAAAAFSAGNIDLLEQPFYAWHLSGGTTELLLVEPNEEDIFLPKIIGGTNDLAAGQLIDRTGKILGKSFPAGPEIEVLADLCVAPEKAFSPSCQEGFFSLSGVENKVNQLVLSGADPSAVSQFVIHTIGNAIEKATIQAMQRRQLPILCAGGVMANRMLQKRMIEKFGSHIASAELSGDNALGIALLAKIKQEGLHAI